MSFQLVLIPLSGGGVASVMDVGNLNLGLQAVGRRKPGPASSVSTRDFACSISVSRLVMSGAAALHAGTEAARAATFRADAATHADDTVGSAWLNKRQDIDTNEMAAR